MKVVVTAQAPTLDSPVDSRFGRARYFLLVDTENMAFPAHDNQTQANAPQGAGIQSAQTIARLGAQAVLTGHVGPKAFAVLQAAHIPVYLVGAGTVRQAIEAFRTGQLSSTSQPDVQGHWT
jgi:predicted Fe-Mo cluster-binding NifX family protein